VYWLHCQKISGL